MNLRRGLFRLWVLVAVPYALLMGSGAYMRMQDGPLIIDGKIVSEWAIVALIALPPLAILAFGAAVFWALSGFIDQRTS